MYFSCLITAQRTHSDNLRCMLWFLPGSLYAEAFRRLRALTQDDNEDQCPNHELESTALWLKLVEYKRIQKVCLPGRENKYSTTLLNHVMLNLWYSISQYIWMYSDVFGIFVPHHDIQIISWSWRTITTNPVGLAICWAGHLSKDTSGYQEEECQHAVSCRQDCCFAVFWLLFS